MAVLANIENDTLKKLSGSPEDETTMKKVLKTSAGLVLGLLMLAPWLSVSRAQNEAGRERLMADSRSQQNASPPQQGPATRVTMKAEEKLVRDVYARLMRYQTAGRDEVAARNNESSRPDDYLTFELQNIHSGPIKEISGQRIRELVTARGGSVLTIKSTHLSTGKDPEHAYYEAEWTVADVKENSERQPGQDDKLVDVESYTSYEVTARLGGRERTYRALVLHRHHDGSLRSSSEILDNITSEMNTVLHDESPRVRSPWNKYVNSALHLAVAREIRETIAAGKPLIPADAPIGYLPGDNTTPGGQDRQALAINAVCEPLNLTVEVNPGEVQPSGIDGVTSTNTTVIVRTSPATANRLINLSAQAVTSSGGHVTHSGARPTGTFTNASGRTDANGVYQTTYTSPIFGGTMTITATAGPASASTQLQISLTGLFDLGDSGTAHYTPTGQLNWHPSNHYGTLTAITNLPLIADDYFASYPTSAKLEYNDMSLINGGKFDINPDRSVAPNWTNAAHAEHREGKNCDIPYGKPNLINTSAQQAVMEQILRNRNSPNFLKHVSPDPLHYHARFQ
jgi:hypothetical protein